MEYCLRQDERFESEIEAEEASLPERAVCCVNCGHEITRESEKITLRGKFSHRLTNPYGVMFCIGCFATAAGCGTAGFPTEEYTWFPGYAWRSAYCSACGVHLGWRFSGSGGAGFFGLILDRLTGDELFR